MARRRPPPLVEEAFVGVNAQEEVDANLVVKNTFLEVPGALTPSHVADARNRAASGLSTAPASLHKIGAMTISLMNAMETPNAKQTSTPSTAFDGPGPLTPTTASATPSTPPRERLWPPTPATEQPERLRNEGWWPSDPSQLIAGVARPLAQAARPMADATRTGAAASPQLRLPRMEGRFYGAGMGSPSPLIYPGAPQPPPALCPPVPPPPGGILATAEPPGSSSPQRRQDASGRSRASWADMEDDDGLLEDGAFLQHPCLQVARPPAQRSPPQPMGPAPLGQQVRAVTRLPVPPPPEPPRLPPGFLLPAPGPAPMAPAPGEQPIFACVANPKEPKFAPPAAPAPGSNIPDFMKIPAPPEKAPQTSPRYQAIPVAVA